MMRMPFIVHKTTLKIYVWGHPDVSSRQIASNILKPKVTRLVIISMTGSREPTQGFIKLADVKFKNLLHPRVFELKVRISQAKPILPCTANFVTVSPILFAVAIWPVTGQGFQNTI